MYNYHNEFLRPTFLSWLMHSGLFHWMPLTLAAPPTPEQFWAVCLWVVIPAVIGIWSVYRVQQERLRRAHRRVRQLEARLAMTSLPQPARPVSAGGLPSVPGYRRVSPLTARILVPAAPAKVRGYTQRVPGPLS